MEDLSYHEISNISRTLGGNRSVDHSDTVGASPVQLDPHSRLYRRFSQDWTKTTAKRDEIHLSFVIWCGLY